jgi:glutamine cyclotransferase
MKTTWRLLMGAMALIAACYAQAEAPVVRPRVVATYPHDPRAFTQGLVLVDDVLLESTGLYGRSTLRRVALRSGRVLALRRLDARHFGEGLAVVGSRLIQLTWRARTGLVHEIRTLDPLGRFTYEGEGWGLAFDGRQLVMSDGSDQLRLLDPGSFAVQRTVSVRDGSRPVTELNELEYVDGALLANVWQTTRIARIDLASGRVLDWIELEALVPPRDRRHTPGVANGIAHDPRTGHLLVTGKLWPVLFEIEVPPVPGVR